MITDIHLKTIALTQVKGIGPATARKLLAYVGSIESIFNEKINILEKVPRISVDIIKAIRSKDNLLLAEKEINFIQKHNISSILLSDKKYPERLKQCDDAPLIIFTLGKNNFNAKKVINIVGTRNITSYGKEFCKTLIEELAKHKPIIVSGLAYGVDTIAHKLALDFNLETVAVLGHSLDKVYPKENTALAKNIIAGGTLISEFTTNTKFEKSNFVRRNRIIAGMSDATVVIESAIKGGALITAEYANSYNRDVFALPGKVCDKYSQGCNMLIKSNKAVLIESVKDIEYIMNWESNGGNIQQTLFIETTPEEDELLSFIKLGEKTNIDIIAMNSKWPISKILSTLLHLEFKGVINSFPGNMYKRNQ